MSPNLLHYAFCFKKAKSQECLQATPQKPTAIKNITRLKKQVIFAHLALFAANFIYAGNYTVAKEVMPDYIQPFGFIMLRALTAFVFFFFLHLFVIKEKVEKKDFGLLALCGLFGVAINQLMFFKGLNWTTPINASLIMTTTPMLVLVASALLLGERITVRKLIGIGLGATGAILLILYGQSMESRENGLLGDLFIFINASSYGVYLVLVKSLMKKYNPMTVMRWVFTFGLIYVIPFGIGDVRQIEWSTFSTNIWLAVAYVLICVTIFAYLFNAIALKIVNPTIVGIYIYSQPLLATLIALFYAKDVLTIEKIGAGLLIFIGVYLVSSKGKASQELEVESQES